MQHKETFFLPNSEGIQSSSAATEFTREEKKNPTIKKPSYLIILLKNNM